MVGELKVDDVVFCRVKSIQGTTVFLEIEDSKLEGSMVLSEVAAGRIRNLNKYVSPNRKIVCKVLKIQGNHAELTLRRVTGKERDEVLERHKKERALKNVLSVVGEKPDGIISKIKEEYDMLDFVSEVRENPHILDKFVSKDKAEKIAKILSEKEAKEKIIGRKFELKSFSESGIQDIKEILDFRDIDIHYLGSGKFSVSVSGADFKEAEKELNEVLDEIEKRAKKKKALLEVQKEKGK